MNVWDLLLNSKDSKEEEDEEYIKRTCIWLKEAGFPQYVQMYNDGEFPISLKLVQEDHYDFDGGTLMALFRRIEILNKSAEIKTETIIEEVSSTIRESINIKSKPKYEIIEDDSSTEDDEDDEDDDKENVLEQTALSSHWSYEPKTRRWSHIDSVQSSIEISTDSPSSNLQKYLGVPLPRPYIPKPTEKQKPNTKRPSTLTSDYHQTFEPIPELNDIDITGSNVSMEVTPTRSDKDLRFSTSHSSDSRDSTSCVSPSSPDSPCINNLDHGAKDKSNHILRSTSLKLMKAVSRLSPHQLSFRHQKRGKPDHIETKKSPVNADRLFAKSDNYDERENQKSLKLKEDNSLHNIHLSDKPHKLIKESYPIGETGWINTRTGSFISRSGNQFDENGRKNNKDINSDLDPIISLLESDVDSLDQMRSKIKLKSSSGSAPSSPVLRRKPGGSSDPNKGNQRLSDIESYTQTKSKGIVHFDDPNSLVNRISSPVVISKSQDEDSFKHLSLSPKLNRNSCSRWSHKVSNNDNDKVHTLYQLIEFSVTQVNILKKLSVLGCTSMLEKYCPSQKNVFNWRLPRLLPQKQKNSLDETALVFGVNLGNCQSRYGQPYPPAILNIFQYLREEGPSAQGIFRKAGMKSRSKILRSDIENNKDFNSFEEYSVFDVADVLKVFFRDLPDRLLTGKLSATLVAIYTYVPKEFRLEGLQLALLSLPDENRTALEVLIEFLSFLASHSEVTKMDSKNLSLIFSPNLFNFPTEMSPTSGMGTLRMKKSCGPNPKQLEEQRASQLCIVDMINNLKTVFQVTDETLKKNHNKMNNCEPRDISQLRSTGLWQEWLCDKFNQLNADTVNHKSGWTNISKDFIRKLHRTNSLVDQLSYRKIGSRDNNADGIALRTWKVVVDIDVSPGYIFTNIKDKRHLWDSSVTSTEVLQEMNEYVDLIRLTSCNADGSSIPRCFNLLRGYQLGLGGSSHIIVAESVNIQHLMAFASNNGPVSTSSAEHSTITGQVFCDNFMIEASSTRTTRVTWISRVDLWGHHSDWYSSHWGHELLRRASSLKRFCESSQHSPVSPLNGPSCDVVFYPAIEEPLQSIITEGELNASRETDL